MNCCLICDRLDSIESDGFTQRICEECSRIVANRGDNPAFTHTEGTMSKVACPWCGYTITEVWDYGWCGQETDGECPNCGKPILLEASTVVTARPDREM